MTYQEFVASKERLAQLEQEYIQAWKEHDIALRKCRKLSAEMERLDNAIKACKHYR